MSSGPVTRKELRDFGLALGVVCLLWAGILYWRGHLGAIKWLLGASPVLVLLALTFPRALRPIHFVWMPVAKGIAKAVTWLLLTLVFFLVFTPYGIVMRLIGRDSLDRKWDPAAKSYWIQREEPFDVERFERQY